MAQQPTPLNASLRSCKAPTAAMPIASTTSSASLPRCWPSLPLYRASPRSISALVAVTRPNWWPDLSARTARSMAEQATTRKDPGGPANRGAGHTPTPPAPPRSSPLALAERHENMKDAGVDAAPIIALSRPFENPVPAELAKAYFDLVTNQDVQLSRPRLPQGRPREDECGGVQGAEEGRLLHHRRPFGPAGPGISESGTLHRVEEAFLRQEVEAADSSWSPKATSCATQRPARQEHARPAASQGRAS